MPAEPTDQIYDRQESLDGNLQRTNTPRTYPRFEGDKEALEEALHLVLHPEGGVKAYPERPFAEGVRFSENGRSKGQFGKAALAATGAFVGGALLRISLVGKQGE